MGVVDRGTQRCGQWRALRGHLWHRVGTVWVEALSHRFKDRGRWEEETGNGGEEWRRGG